MGWFTAMTIKMGDLKVSKKNQTLGSESRLGSGMTNYINMHGTKDNSGDGSTMDGSRNLMSGTTKAYDSNSGDGLPNRVLTDYDFIANTPRNNNMILEDLDEAKHDYCKTEGAKASKTLGLPQGGGQLPLIGIKKKDGQGQNMTMDGFELKYGDSGDYMNDYRMLDFKVVREKNYRTMLKKAEIKVKDMKSGGGLGNRSSTERARVLGSK
jgi:hypothetical protein